MNVHRIASAGYSAAGADYERARPGYPVEAVWLLVAELGLRPGRTLLDLAAGTGKLTRLLRPSGATVLAVEPVADMLARLPTDLAVHRVAGTAERIPLTGESVHAAVVGTAFHWFDGDRALFELGRVLRPGGGLGLVWNNPDRATDWVDRVWGIVDAQRGDAPRNADHRWRAAFDRTRVFTPLEHRRFHHEQTITPDELLARVASIAFIAALSTAGRRAVLKQVTEQITTHPDLCGQMAFALPYRTDAYWCRKHPR